MGQTLAGAALQLGQAASATVALVTPVSAVGEPVAHLRHWNTSLAAVATQVRGLARAGSGSLVSRAVFLVSSVGTVCYVVAPLEIGHALPAATPELKLRALPFLCVGGNLQVAHTQSSTFVLAVSTVLKIHISSGCISAIKEGKARNFH